MKQGFVYILTNKKDGVLYIGVTNDLLRRVKEHKDKTARGFSYKYNCDKLIYYEQTNDITRAIEREKRLKKWNREWKVKLINKFNPEWNDLYFELGGV